MADDRAALTKQVKEANDIVTVIGNYVQLRSAGPTFKGLCPFHDDHRPSFDVDPRRQRYRCWSCGKTGDVFTFIQEQERVDFREALELLARRAGISLGDDADSAQHRRRALMLDLVRWAADCFHKCYLDSNLALAARQYVGERGLLGETVRRFGVGFAPANGDWLLQQAQAERKPLEMLIEVGLLGRRADGTKVYDRFRDRVLFPIRDVQGRPVAFGGRILPTSPYADRAPKYYNSTDTPLFTKSEHLYGLDVARQATATAGFLAVVEGYTDVLMAHQHGIANVVSTMGTALNARHVRQLRRFVPRVVLVFDADAGGDTGVDRALEIFASEEIELAIATLPQGLDPCDLLVQQGAEAFRAVLAGAVDALEFKLDHVLEGDQAHTIEGRRRAIEAVLGIMARAPEFPSQALAVKQELMLTRLVQRLGVPEASLRTRWKELRQSQRPTPRPEERPPEKRQAPAPVHEKELLEVLLADPDLVPVAAEAIRPEELQHQGLRLLLSLLYGLLQAGEPATLDQIALKLDNQALLNWAWEHQEIGCDHPDRPGWLQQILAAFERRRVQTEQREVQSRLHAVQDHGAALELLRQLQRRGKSLDAR